ncbi:MAG: BON domain-containing protein [Gammaproteobacteria bacterium]|nr:BON domain-containing protein [Gammaproteobacteria bacterium]MDE2346490.1 BON domain-containing protein [Gammaproteobacteria bacterium]
MRMKNCVYALASACLIGAMLMAASGCASNKNSDQPMFGERAGSYMDDAYITSAVKTKLLGDIALKSFHIHVVTKERVVTLSGTVSSAELMDEAIKTAKSVDGVKDVVSDIKVSGK